MTLASRKYMRAAVDPIWASSDSLQPSTWTVLGPRLGALLGQSVSLCLLGGLLTGGLGRILQGVQTDPRGKAGTGQTPWKAPGPL